MGVKKSTVSTAAVSSDMRHTAASSLVSNPSSSLPASAEGMSFAPRRASASSTSSRSPGPHFAAQPPCDVSCVSRARSFSLIVLPSFACAGIRVLSGRSVYARHLRFVRLASGRPRISNRLGVLHPFDAAAGPFVLSCKSAHLPACRSSSVVRVRARAWTQAWAGTDAACARVLVTSHSTPIAVFSTRAPRHAIPCLFSRMSEVRCRNAAYRAFGRDGTEEKGDAVHGGS